MGDLFHQAIRKAAKIGESSCEEEKKGSSGSYILQLKQYILVLVVQNVQLTTRLCRKKLFFHPINRSSNHTPASSPRAK